MVPKGLLVKRGRGWIGWRRRGTRDLLHPSTYDPRGARGITTPSEGSGVAPSGRIRRDPLGPPPLAVARSFPGPPPRPPRGTLAPVSGSTPKTREKSAANKVNGGRAGGIPASAARAAPPSPEATKRPSGARRRQRVGTGKPRGLNGEG